MCEFWPKTCELDHHEELVPLPETDESPGVNGCIQPTSEFGGSMRCLSR